MTNPYLYWPNLLGYLRILTAFLSFYLMPRFPKTSMIVYFGSVFADAFDGQLARKFNQSTRFGACLDMVTDRFCTAALCIQLALFYPSWAFVIQGLVALDFASHYYQMFCSLSQGEASHKDVDETKNPLLRIYYTNKPVLFTLCLFNELFFVFTYLWHWHPTGFFYYGYAIAIAICTPGFLLKQLMNVIQLASACDGLMVVDNLKKRRKVEKGDVTPAVDAVAGSKSCAVRETQH